MLSVSQSTVRDLLCDVPKYSVMYSVFSVICPASFL